MNEYIGISKYSRRPKRENEKTLKTNGKARANFSSHKGSFKNEMSHTLFTNAQNISGIENKGRSCKFIDYISDKDKALAIYGDKDGAKEHYRKIENEILPKRANSVIQRRLTVQLPREFLSNADKNLENISKMLDEKYFSRSGAFVIALHDGGADFRNPHLHIVFSGRDANLKNIREYHDKNFLNAVKKDIAQFISQEIGVKCKVSTERKNSRHYPRWVSEAFKKYKNQPDQLKKYCDKYEILANYVNDINYRNNMKELKNEEKEFNREYTAFAKKNKKVFDKIHGKEEQEIKQKVEKIKKEVMNMDLEPLRNIDVVELAERMGFVQDKADKKAYRRGDMKISIDDKTGRFNSFTNPDVHGRGSIDFIMRTEQKDFKSAVEFLTNEYSIAQPERLRKSSFQQEKEPEKKQEEPKIIEMPKISKYDQRTLDYLIWERKISMQTVKELQRAGKIYQDEKNNVVFVCKDVNGEITGAELKGTMAKFAGMAKGSNRDKGAFYIYQAEPKTLVLTESAIDAISYKELKNPKNAIIISTAGVMPHGTSFIDEVIKRYGISNVKIAYDNDQPGQENANKLKVELEKKYPELKVEIVKSVKKDWNEDLTAQELQNSPFIINTKKNKLSR